MSKTADPKKAKQSQFEFRRFQTWLYALHGLALVVLGLSLFPMIFFFWWVWHSLATWPIALKILIFSFSLAFGYFLFGTCLIFICVLTKNVLGFRIRPGLFPMYSIEALRWMSYNSLILIANAAFLDVLRISPFQTLFYRLMGAKIGQDVNVNTAGLADLEMLEIGNHVVVGGGVALICHAVDRGMLRLEPTKISDKVSIGLGSIVMPGCEIGEGASIAPMSYLPRGTKIPARGYWGGNPLRDLRLERRNALQSENNS